MLGSAISSLKVENLKLYGVLGHQLVRCINQEVPRLILPKRYPKIEFPERRKLRIMEKVPTLGATEKPRKHFKDLKDMKGPEPVNTFLIHKQCGVRALHGGNLKHGHFEMIRTRVGKKMDESRMFAQWRVDAPWKPVTKKGTGKRMGGGKGSVNHYITPVRAGRIIFELAGYFEFNEVLPFLRNIASLLPFAAQAISQEMLENEKVEQEQLARENINPISFEYCANNNILGIQKWLSPYDYIWHNKYR